MTAKTSIEGSEAELEELANLSEAVSLDPDAAVPARYRALMRKYAMSGAIVGTVNAAPTYVSVDGKFLERASS